MKGTKSTRIEEKIVIQMKRPEFLDNYQYKETKAFGKNPKPATVIHRRFESQPVLSSQETTMKKVTTTKTTETKTQANTTTKTEENLRNKPKVAGETSATATKTVTSTTKVGRRGGAGGATSTTTETTSKVTTTRTTKRGNN